MELALRNDIYMKKVWLGLKTVPENKNVLRKGNNYHDNLFQ